MDGQKKRAWARAAFCSVLASVFTDASCVFARPQLGHALAALVVTFRSSARPIAVKRERRSTPKAFVWQQPAQGQIDASSHGCVQASII